MDSYSKIYQELDGLSFEELNKVLMHQSMMSEKQNKQVTILHALRDYKTNQQMAKRRDTLKKELLEQREEILKHKWFLSEKVGYDVGTTAAALDWVKCGYAEQWRNKTGVYSKRQGS